MFEYKLTTLQTPHQRSHSYSGNQYAQQYNTVLSQFKSTLFQGQVFRLIRKLLRRPHRLYDLNALKPDLHLRGSSYAGIQTVPMRSIIGSEGRTADFDMDFHPLSPDACERWVNIAIAYSSCLPLPPVQLIQVGNAYFVRDGHHRISVGRAFGQVAVDAEVITWKAIPPFPWQPKPMQKKSAFAKALTYPLD